MAEQDAPESGAARLGRVIYRVCRGAAVAVLALGIYVAITNWEGSGSVWAFRYAGIALVVHLAGRGARYLLGRMQ